MKMKVNCDVCDARNVSEETLKTYEKIKINCDLMLVTPEAKNLLNRYAVNLNCDNVMELTGEVQLRSVNGAAQIKATDVTASKIYLQVNGSLEIGPGTEKVLEQYVGIQVNGAVTYPESISAFLGKLSVNGVSCCYPDDAIVLKRNTVIDRTFALRAKARHYWSAGRMVMVDPLLDGEALVKKGATFSAKEVILAESKVESLLEAIDEETQITIVPDGTRVILDDVELNEATVKRYGRKLYVVGDVDVPEEGGQALEQVEYLHIRGDVRTARRWKDLLLEKGEIQGAVKIRKGRCITDCPSVRVSKWMLEEESEGLQVEDCVEVSLDEDIPGKLIMDRLTICDCVRVKCTREQESALALICQDVVQIGMGEAAAGEETVQADTRVVNADQYVL